MEQDVPKVTAEYVRAMLKRNPEFTGQIVINFKDGIAMDVQEMKRTKL